MMTARHPFHALWMAHSGADLLLQRNMVAAQAAKTFPVSQFSYFISDYEAELAKLSKSVTKTKPEIEADIAAAEAAGNAAPGRSGHRTAAHQASRPIPPCGCNSPPPCRKQSRSTIPMATRCRRAMIGAGLRAYMLAPDAEDEAAALAIAAAGLRQARDTGARRCWPTRKA